MAAFLTAAGALTAGAEEVYFQTDLYGEVPGLEEIERAMFEEVNRVRQENGVPPLLRDEGLTYAARQHSEEMKRLFYFAHDSPTPGLRDVMDRVYNAGLTDMSIAENLVSENNVPPESGAEEVGRELTELLLASTYHRDNIMDRRFTHSGIGSVATEEGTVFCTQVFSKRTIEFKYVKLKKEIDTALRVNLILHTDETVGVWLDEKETYVFHPESRAVTLDLVFRYGDGPRNIVLARRPVDGFGAMKGFFVGSFDPRKPLNFEAGITEVEVISEKQTLEETTFYVLRAEGKLLSDEAKEMKLADGDVRYGVSVKGRKFKAEYPIATGSGLHEIYFVVDTEASHAVKVDADGPLATAFSQLEPQK